MGWADPQWAAEQRNIVSNMLGRPVTEKEAYNNDSLMRLWAEGKRKQILEATPEYLKSDLSETNKLPGQEYLDRGMVGAAQDDLFANYNLAQQGPSNVNQRVNPADQSRTLVNKSGQYASRSAIDDHTYGMDRIGLGGEGFHPIDTAISKKYQGLLNNQLKAAQVQRQVEQPLLESTRQMRSGSVFVNQQQIRMRNFQEQLAFQQRRQELYNQYANAKAEAEAALWSSVLGGTLSVASIGLFGGGKK